MGGWGIIFAARVAASTGPRELRIIPQELRQTTDRAAGRKLRLSGASWRQPTPDIKDQKVLSTFSLIAKPPTIVPANLHRVPVVTALKSFIGVALFVHKRINSQGKELVLV